MNFFKKHPLYFSLLIALGVICLAELGLIWMGMNRSEESVRKLKTKENELRMLEATRPYPSEANKRAVEEDLARTEKALTEMRKELAGDLKEGLREEEAPTDRVKMYFLLSNFVDETRRKAAAAGIALKPEERFGFTTYAHEGPPKELIDAVYRQRQVIRFLVEAMLDAKPRAIVGVQRTPVAKVEVPVVAAVKGRAGGDDTKTGGDFFVMNPLLSANVEGFVKATAFRVCFEGETDSMRLFLNRLAGFELPLVVRSVEVLPVGGAVVAGPKNLAAIFGDAKATTGAVEKPLVEKKDSRFTVTVELIEFVEEKKGGR